MIRIHITLDDNSSFTIPEKYSSFKKARREAVRVGQEGFFENDRTYYPPSCLKRISFTGEERNGDS